MDGININGQNLTLQELVDISRFNNKVNLDNQTKEKVNKSRDIVELKMVAILWLIWLYNVMLEMHQEV